MSWMPDATAPDATVTPADFDLGRAALLEITTADTIGDNAGSIDEGEGVVSVHFETTLAGYPGWHWTVSIARVNGEEPSVLETELLPGDGALLAPDWTPWIDRLADYRAAQEAAGLEAADAEDSDDDGDADDDDTEDDDDDELDNDVLHGGDLDGVDIDEVADDDLDDEADDLDDHIADDDELFDEDGLAVRSGTDVPPALGAPGVGVDKSY
ncbi:MAG: hypothetical protein QOK46_788 [Microbacteriaceae bacterium]|nr:hypothetical protein [Microbacteriaceae bacterium]MDQ1553710.1 hypothetical protein [Microbacteriaceae bacterium]